LSDVKRIATILAGVCGCTPMAVASDPAPHAEWIERLASEAYRERQEATEKLWALGDDALDALTEASRSRDPEVALRALDLLRRIDLGISPKTDPEILKLTEQYRAATLVQKTTIFNRLRSLKAWRQIMRLYANETDAAARAELAQMVDGIALNAARERLVHGEADFALEFLKMSGQSDGALISIAAFHRAHGTLAQELEKAANAKTPEEFRWLAALQRAADDAQGAAASARAAGDTATAAVLAMLEGDPLPWLQWKSDANQRTAAGVAQYARAAAMRWRGEDLAEEIDTIRRLSRSHNDTTRWRGQAFLFLLGDPEPAWKSLHMHDPEEAFIHLDAGERVADALRVMEIDPADPDYGKYLTPLLDRVLIGPGENPDLEEDRDTAAQELMMFCAFLEKRGAHEVLDTWVKPRFLAFAAKHPPRFTDLMSELFSTPGLSIGASELATRIAIEWAGNDDARWREMVIAAFGEVEEYVQWWELTAKLDPSAGPADRMRGLLAMFGYNRDPENLYQRWIDLAWKHLEKAPEANESPAFKALAFLVSSVNDTALADRFATINPDRDDEEAIGFDTLLADSAAERWDRVADTFLKQIATMAENGEARAEFHAYAAASLRRAGRHDEVAAHEAWAELLALGDMRTNFSIGQAYAFGRDYVRAAAWFRRALMESPPDDVRFSSALSAYLGELLEMRDYARIAGCSEVLAHMQAAEVADSGAASSPTALMMLRQQADFARALALPAEQSDEARRLLRAAHALMPTGGSLADHFFPALATSSFTDLHNELFEISWAGFVETLKIFPDADNTMNTAVWFASRSLRRLEEAKKIQQRALAINPRSPAYLDTLAEVFFALGNRREAVRYGALAVRFMPGDSMIIRQFERFQHGEMPGK
jgi:tetratricopeptide (TPR) repeat protein